MQINFNSFCLSLGGGNRVILELADGLTERGHDVTITHMGCPSYYSWYGKPKCKMIDLNPNAVLRFFKKYYLRKKGFDYNLDGLLAQSIPPCDVNVATENTTVYPTLFSGKGKPVYLVQHYESLFHPDDPVKAAKAEFTYDLPLQKLCVSNWLARKVNGEYLGNGINLKKFRNLGLKRVYDIMVISRNIPWKGNYSPVVSGLRAKGYRVLVVSDVSEAELVQSYNVSKTFVYLSDMKEGFGLPPIEAMRCGSVAIMTPCTEYCVHEENSLLLNSEDFVEQIDGYLADLKNESYINSLVKGGAETAIDFDFKDVIDRFIDLVQ